MIENEIEDNLEQGFYYKIYLEWLNGSILRMSLMENIFRCSICLHAKSEKDVTFKIWREACGGDLYF